MPGRQEPQIPLMTGQVWAMLLALAVLWGGSFFFNGVAVRELPSFTLVWLRVCVAAVTLLGVLRLLGQSMPRSGRVWAAFAGMGLLNNAVPFVLIVWGQHHIAGGLAAILNATTPLFTVLAAHLLTPDEKITRFKMAGVVLGFAGAVVTIGSDALSGLGISMLAQLACLAAALVYAFAGIFGRRFRRMGIPPMATAAGQVCASTVLLLPVMLFVDRPWYLPIPDITTVGAVLGMGVLSTALAYVLYFRILAAAGATNLLLVTFLIPASAVGLGWAILGEAPQPRQVGGMALIGLGLTCIDGRLLKLALRKRDAGRTSKPARGSSGQHRGETESAPGRARSFSQRSRMDRA